MMDIAVNVRSIMTRVLCDYRDIVINCFFILIAVGHSASSSTSRPFHFDEDHPLISTLHDRLGAVGWDTFFIHNL